MLGKKKSLGFTSKKNQIICLLWIIWGCWAQRSTESLSQTNLTYRTRYPGTQRLKLSSEFVYCRAKLLFLNFILHAGIVMWEMCVACTLLWISWRTWGILLMADSRVPSEVKCFPHRQLFTSCGEPRAASHAVLPPVHSCLSVSLVKGNFPGPAWSVQNISWAAFWLSIYIYIKYKHICPWFKMSLILGFRK